MVTAKHDEFRPIAFPRDELPHDCSIEWWYWNGHLHDRAGNEYAYMTCLFKADTKKAKIPMLSNIPVETVFFRHSILSDIAAKKSYPIVSNYVITSTDSFTKPLLHVNFMEPSLTSYFNSVIEETEQFRYHLKNEQIDLRLVSEKSPLLVAGKGFFSLDAKKSTYYYSLTTLRTNGTIIVGGKPVEVEGVSWMDHQWANASYMRDKWVWCSLQLENGCDILCVRYGDGDGALIFASISGPDGTQRTATDVRLTPTGTVWRSKKTKAEYPLSWRIEIPGEQMVLEVRPKLLEQEVLFTTINYWEGPMAVSATVKGTAVSGNGFLELVGFPSEYGRVAYAKGELNSLFRSMQNFFGSKKL